MSNIHQPAASLDLETLHPGYFDSHAWVTDPEVWALTDAETRRQHLDVELVASENFVSQAVLDVQGAAWTNKTVVGYPGRRFHAGAEHADALERLAVDRACRLFGCTHANVQPHSGIQANLAVFRALLVPGDTLLSLSGADGGHFSHGGAANLSGSMAQAVFYGVDPDTMRMDYAAIARLAQKHHPRLIVVGGAAYPREIDFPKMREIADSVGAWLMADIAHFAGLVVAGCTPHPFPHCDIVTTTTYKSLRGARGGIILTNDGGIADRLEKATSPGVQGSPLLHALAGKAVCLGEALRPEFRVYGRAVLENARALAEEIMRGGNDVLTGGTDTPLILVDLRAKGLYGQPLVESLDRAGITCNRCEIPGDTTDPTLTAGLRLGASACTTRGLGIAEFRRIGGWINDMIAAHAQGSGLAACEARIRDESHRLMSGYPLYVPGVVR